MNQYQPKRILIVDDNTAVCQMLKRLLEMQGYQAHIVHKGLDAIRMIRDLNYNLILLDIMLPELDGYKICRMIKFDTTTKNIPVIILTSRDTAEDKLLAKQCGADAFIGKTTATATILNIIQKIFTQHAEV